MAIQTNFSTQIPPEMLDLPNVRKLVSVLDNLRYEQLDELYLIESLFDPRRLNSDNFFALYMFELGRLTHLPGMPPKLVQSLIIGAYDIWSKKGTREGLYALGRACLGDAEVDFTNLRIDSMLIPGDVYYGYAPDSKDLTINVTAPTNAGVFDRIHPVMNPFVRNGYTHPISGKKTELFYAFSGDFTDYYNGITIALISPYFHIREFRRYIVSLLPSVLPNIQPEASNINVYLYTRTSAPFPQNMNLPPDYTITYTNNQVIINPL
jgi:hypothetical protein